MFPLAQLAWLRSAQPSDTPHAGEEVLAWFALVRQGGEPIPLADCNCALAVYAQPEDQPYEGKTPDLSPNLEAINAEGYQDIPGARLTFPDVGAYTLVLTGEPKQVEDFTPFSLAFEKTVASGVSTPKIPANPEAALPSPTRIPNTDVIVVTYNLGISYVRWAIIGIGLVAVIAIASALFRRPR